MGSDGTGRSAQNGDAAESFQNKIGFISSRHSCGSSWNRATESVIESQPSDGGSHDTGGSVFDSPAGLIQKRLKRPDVFCMYFAVQYILQDFKVLNRRSDRKSYTREGFIEMVKYYYEEPYAGKPHVRFCEWLTL